MSGSPRFIVPTCEHCGERPAACLGRYADHNEEDCPHEDCAQHRGAYACNECCGHACEDGQCRPLELSDYQRLEMANG